MLTYHSKKETMKKIKNILVLILVTSICFTSCDDYLDVNDSIDNPNLSELNPNQLIVGAQSRSAETYTNRVNRIGNWMGVAWSGNYLAFNDAYGPESRYQFSTTFYNDVWDNLYRFTSNFATIENYEDGRNWNNQKAAAKKKAEAEAANKSKTRFLAAASHDLMQPFNALSLFTSMLKQKVAETELAELANHIQDSLNVVEGLLSDLVEISRLDSGSQKLNIKRFPLADMLVPLRNEFTLLAAQQNIDFNYQDTSCYVQTDQRMLRRIIQNFLSNAVHYCPREGDKRSRILLGVRRSKGKVRIEVWDNGPGIPQEKQQKIFREFERLEQNREVPGLGLGLTISDRIAKLSV